MVRFFAELKRRNVIRMAGLYLVSAWLLVQVAATLLPVFSAPEWVMRVLVGLLVVGFIPALVVSWVFELTPKGLERDPADSASAEEQGRRRRRSDAVVVSAQSVAVLPFINLAAEVGAAPFVDGMHDDLLTQLAKIGALKVISRTSVQEYRNSHKNLRQIAAELGVATVLEGGVQQVGARVRINAQLVDARTDQHLWAETYDRELSAQTLFELQSEIARCIATALRAQLLPQESAMMQRHLTNDLGAWMAYREAQRLNDRADAGDFDQASLQLDLALERDPAFAAAWALRSRIAIGRFWFHDPSEANLEASRTALTCGMAMDPESPELKLAEGYFHYWGRRDYVRALQAADAALQALPNSADLHRLKGFILRRKGDWAASVVAQQRALEFDPRNAFGHTELAMTLLKLGDYAGVQIHIDAALALDPQWGFARMTEAILLLERDGDLPAARQQLAISDPGNSQPAYRHWWLLVASGAFTEALALADFGRYTVDRTFWWPPALIRGLTQRYHNGGREAMLHLETARAQIETRLQTQPGFEPALTALCITLGALGRREEVIKQTTALLANAAPDAMQRDETRYLAATALALAGADSAALDLLEQHFAEPHYNGTRHLALDPAFSGLRAAPRFSALLKRHRVDRANLPAPARVMRRSDRLLLVALVLLLGFLGWRWWQQSAGPTSKPAALVAAAAVTSPAETPIPPKSIAVLPFTSFSEVPENEFFADGLSEEILNSLVRLDAMQVAGRTSSFHFKGSTEDLRSIGRALGVSHLLEGSVRRDGEQVRITAQLVRTSDGIHVWSQTYDRTLSNLLDVQLDIAEKVAAALDVVMDDGQRERMREAGLNNVDAFIAFQKGRKLYSDAHDPARSKDLISKLRLANAEFERTIALAPDFAPAYYLATDLYSHLVMSDETATAQREQALLAARRDLDMAAVSTQDSAERLLIEVDRQLISDNWNGLGERLKSAVKSQGSRQSNWLPLAAIFGLAAERVEATRRAIVRDPLASIGYFNAAHSANWAGQPQLALDFVGAANRTMGGSPTITLQGIRAELALGQLQLAREQASTLDTFTVAGAMARLLLAAAQREDLTALRLELTQTRQRGWNPELWVAVDLLGDSLAGDVAAANRRAALIDAEPGGALKLASFVSVCQCGVPFDLSATPEFAARIAESGAPWPPLDLIKALRQPR